MMLLPGLRPFNIGPPSSSPIPFGCALAVPDGAATPISRVDQPVGPSSMQSQTFEPARRRTPSTAGRAESGRVQFNRASTPCHVSGDTPTPSKTGRGFWLGDQPLLLNLGGRYAHRYPSVYHLFHRVRDSMPSSDANSVSVAAKMDIVAYML